MIIKESDKEKKIVLKNLAGFILFIILAVFFAPGILFLLLMWTIDVVNLRLPPPGVIIFTVILGGLFYFVYAFLYSQRVVIKQNKKTADITLQRVFFIKNKLIIYKKSEKPYLEICKLPIMLTPQFERNVPKLKTKAKSEWLYATKGIFFRGWYYSKEQVKKISYIFGIPIKGKKSLLTKSS